MPRRRPKPRKKKKKGGHPAGQGPGLSEALLDELLAVENRSGLDELLVKRPELSSGRVGRELRELAAAPGFGAPFGHLAALLREARADRQAAWEKYQAARARGESLGQELEHEDALIEAALDCRQFDEALALIEAALPKAQEAGLGMELCHLHSLRGLALLRKPSDDRAHDLELSIEAHEAALELAISGEQAADLLMHLGLVYTERVRGDRSQNIEQAVALLRAALREQVDPASDPELQAMMRTNLAMALMKSDGQDRVSTLSEAAELCADALAFRSPERNGTNWAYTQINLGDILEHLSKQGEREPAEARRAYERVIEEEGRIDEKWLVGGAHHALGRSYLEAADVSAEDVLEADEAGELDSAFDNTALLQTALDHLRKAHDLMRDAPDPLRRAYVLDHLSEALAELEADDESIVVAREALTVLRPTTAPRDCLRVAGRLGNLLALREEWEEAADAFADAVSAADMTFHARLETSAREEEMQRCGSLSRWASYAIARRGDPMQAALVLENGRARELRRRLGLRGKEETRLSELPAELQQAFTVATGEMAAAPMGAEGTEAARTLQEVVAAVREIAGFADFMTGTHAEDLTAALEPGWPLVFVNPTPYGTLLLRLSLTGDSGLSVTPTFLDSPRAIEVFMHLMAGEAADFEDPAEAESASSYLFGISGQSDAPRDFKADLDHILPWLGTAIGRPLTRGLAEIDAEGVTLVMCGPIGVTPLHAAHWQDEVGVRCLLDDYEVRYAPSAALGAAALDRGESRNRAKPHLVALADPEDNLPAATPEVIEIARHFGGAADCAFGQEADHAFLRGHAHEATHLHLACHASGGLFGVDETFVRLADGPVSVFDLTALAGLQTRVVAVSACQSALSEIAGLPDEAFSIGTAMLGAGSASVIASLWPVDDLATALLMTRTYQEMLGNQRRPPEALRRAQLWLRDLTGASGDAFLGAHPALAEEFGRRLSQSDPPGRRGSGSTASEAQGPYSHPDYWAGFVAVGA